MAAGLQRGVSGCVKAKVAGIFLDLDFTQHLEALVSATNK
jgi:hypothetical protein